jgi:hypothetical protein
LRIKLQPRWIDDTTDGNARVEPRLSLIYTETVEKRGYGLPDFGLASTSAVKIMGLYPRKGALAIGSDAVPQTALYGRRRASPRAPLRRRPRRLGQLEPLACQQLPVSVLLLPDLEGANPGVDGFAVGFGIGQIDVARDRGIADHCDRQLGKRRAI